MIPCHYSEPVRYLHTKWYITICDWFGVLSQLHLRCRYVSLGQMRALLVISGWSRIWTLRCLSVKSSFLDRNRTWSTQKIKNKKFGLFTEAFHRMVGELVLPNYIAHMSTDSSIWQRNLMIDIKRTCQVLSTQPVEICLACITSNI